MKVKAIEFHIIDITNKRCCVFVDPGMLRGAANSESDSLSLSVCRLYS